MYKNLILPASVLAETIIGAGMFALPFVFFKAGLVFGLFYLFFFSAIFALTHLMYADVILRTRENHRFAGYAGIYLGRFGFWLTAVITILGGIFALTIYLILSASFIGLALPLTPDIYKILIFWLFCSIAVFWRINRLTISEFLILLGSLAIVLILLFFGLKNFNEALSETPLFNFSYVLAPLGAVFFSMGGRVAVPAVLGYFRNNGEKIVEAKKPIIFGSFFPAFVYVLFVLGILGLSGNVSEDSVSGIVGGTPLFILLILGLLGIVSLFSTYIVIGRDIKKSLEHDFKFPQIFSGLAVAVTPLILYFLGLRNFMELVGFAGGIFVGLDNIILILIWQKAVKTESSVRILNKINPAIIYFLFLVFTGGIIYTLLY